MKPFNLEEAKAGAPVQTRDGKPVRILDYSRTNTAFPISAIMEDGNLFVFGLDGKSPFACASSTDLFMVEGPKTFYVYVYKNTYGGISRTTRLIPTSNTNLKQIARIKVSYTEGQFDL